MYICVYKYLIGDLENEDAEECESQIWEEFVGTRGVEMEISGEHERGGSLGRHDEEVVREMKM